MTKPKGKNKRPGSVNPVKKPAPNSKHVQNAKGAEWDKNKLNRKG